MDDSLPLQALADPQMQAHPLADGDARIEHALVQRMDERVPAGHGPIRPLGHARGAKEPSATSQRVAQRLGFVGVDAVHGRARCRELCARHAGGPQDCSLLGSQPVDLILDHLPERLRGLQDDIIGGDDERPLTIELVHLSPSDQIIDGVHQEEWVAVGVATERLC